MTAKHRPFERTRVKDLGGYWLTNVDVYNAAFAYKAANPDTRRFGAKAPWEHQVCSTTDWLKEQGKDIKGGKGEKGV